jgi:hypothetical protein
MLFKYYVQISKLNVSITRIREFLLRDEINQSDITHLEDKGLKFTLKIYF